MISHARWLLALAAVLLLGGCLPPPVIPPLRRPFFSSGEPTAEVTAQPEQPSSDAVK